MFTSKTVMVWYTFTCISRESVWSKYVDSPYCEAAVQKLIYTVTAACDATLPRQYPWRKTRGTYWWTEEIAKVARKFRIHFEKIRIYWKYFEITSCRLWENLDHFQRKSEEIWNEYLFEDFVRNWVKRSGKSAKVPRRSGKCFITAFLWKLWRKFS